MAEKHIEQSGYGRVLKALVSVDVRSSGRGRVGLGLFFRAEVWGTIESFDGIGNET